MDKLFADAAPQSGRYERIVPPEKRDWADLCQKIASRVNKLWFGFFNPLSTGKRLDRYIVAGEYDVLSNLMEFARELKPNSANIEANIEDTCSWMERREIGQSLAMPLADCLTKAKRVWSMRNNKELSSDALAFLSKAKKPRESYFDGESRTA